MKVTIRKESLTVTIEAEQIPEEVLQRLIKAVYGSPEQITATLSGADLRFGASRFNGSAQQFSGDMKSAFGNH